MQRSTSFLVAVSAGLLACGASQAAVVIASYDFNSASGSPTTSVPLVTSSAVTAGPNVNNSLVFTANQAQITNSAYEEVKANAHTNGQYITFNVEADAGKTLDLTQLQYKHSRTNSAPRRLAVFASKDAGAFAEIQDVGNGNSSVLPTLTVNLDGGAYDGLGKITFRFVFYDNNTLPGLARFDDFELMGDVVPEPASLALASLGGLALLGRRRRNV